MEEEGSGPDPEKLDIESIEVTRVNCDDGFLIPLLYIDKTGPRENPGKSVLYFLILVYLLLGIAIYLNKLMESLETITSQMKRISVSDPVTGKPQVIFVKIWNQTVANLVMALCSSFPIIFIAIIEVVARSFNAGDIGPFTIMGSAAFNLFLAVGVSNAFVPYGQVRKIKNFWPFFLIACWSVIIYIWLYISMDVLSLGEIQSWEASVTMVCFLLCSIFTTVAAMGLEDRSQNELIKEYSNNFQHYRQIVETISGRNPRNSEKEIVNKVSESSVYRKPNSWAYYVGRATNKIAGRCILQKLTERGMDETDVSEDKTTMVDKALIKANNGGITGMNIWGDQFLDLVNIESVGGQSLINWIIHIITFPWKCLVALIPPAAAFGGYVAFVMSSIGILILSTIIVDVTGHLGCYVYVSDSVSSYIIVTIGLNITHLAAAVLAANEEDTADLPLLCLLAGNVFSSSLGFGLSWLLGSNYEEARHDSYEYEYGTSAVFIIEYLVIGTIAIIILLGRRCCVGGELGGSLVCKIITTLVFLLFWLIFLISIPLDAYQVVNLKQFLPENIPKLFE